jgi:splicing factor 1
MSWRNQGITGSNNIPLGNRRRFGGDDGGAQDGGYVPSPSSDGMADSSYKRGRSPARGISLPSKNA